MPRFEEDYGNVNNMNRQRDLVLSTNEFCFLQSKTNGAIKTYTGPITMTISAQESLVTFNPKTKRFVETTDFEAARQLFVSAPEGWYVVLKNPSTDGSHPELAKAVNSPELHIGRKINIPGPVSFSLFPGQMAKVVRGHRLRSNQYLLARVYDADAAKANAQTSLMIDSEGKEVKVKTEEYFVGQLLVIKGTEVSFYIPPTGIEVIPINGEGSEYVRNAVTLERLEYVILKDESGEKRYVPGPAVVFPKPTETFVQSNQKTGDIIFRALELSPISGIYVKVIADYTDETGEHKTGEELFITGKDQMIYYPRVEHAMIQYDGKYMHHAIAIPEGEGRYVLNRLSGEIKTVKGPAMYLPDPRTEVVVKRKLSMAECELFYPGNQEVIDYNMELSEQAVEKAARKGLTGDRLSNALNCAYSTADSVKSLALFEATSNISRGVSYTKPRTITLDTKYDGVVGVDVWTGYAINVVSKTGKREVVVGPTTKLLDYNETLEAMSLSTGKPKTTDNLLRTAFLRVDNNKISDIINVQTKDYVDVRIKVSYCVDFLRDYKDKWFSVENYVKYLCDKQRSLLKKEAKKYNIEEFYNNYSKIVSDVCLNHTTDKKNEKNESSKFNGRFFPENGMLVKDVEVLKIEIESKVAGMLEKHQSEMVSKALELSVAEKNAEVDKQLADFRLAKAERDNKNDLYLLELQQQYDIQKFADKEALLEKERVAKQAAKQAEADMQKILDAIHTAQLEREKSEAAAEAERQTKLAEIEKSKQDTYAETVKKIMESISPDLVAALTTKSNADLVIETTKNMSPIALAKGESVADTVNTLLRGTPLEEVLDKMGTKISM